MLRAGHKYDRCSSHLQLPPSTTLEVENPCALNGVQHQPTKTGGLQRRPGGAHTARCVPGKEPTHDLCTSALCSWPTPRPPHRWKSTPAAATGRKRPCDKRMKSLPGKEGCGRGRSDTGAQNASPTSMGYPSGSRDSVFPYDTAPLHFAARLTLGRLVWSPQLCA